MILVMGIACAVGVGATLNPTQQAISTGAKRFVFISSVKVNGEETASNPFTASDPPAPLAPYGQSKFEAEITLRDLSRYTNLEVEVIRPPLVCGPGVRANFLKLMQLVKKGVPLAGIARVLGKSAETSRVLGSLQVDIAHAKSTLGWQPVVSMQEGLDKTVAHFLAHR